MYWDKIQNSAARIFLFPYILSGFEPGSSAPQAGAMPIVPRRSLAQLYLWLQSYIQF
jgi:hypothetical protein